MVNKLKNKPKNKFKNKNMTISVIITNWMRQEFILEIMEQLNNQSFPKDKYEAIIVDDNSENKDRVFQIFRTIKEKYKDIKIRFFETYKETTMNPAKRYNIGARHASNDILILNESDLLMEGEYLTQVSQFHSSRCMALCPRVIHLYDDKREEPEDLRNLTDLGLSIHRDVFYKVRGFDERSKGWGDIETDFINRLSRLHIGCFKDISLTVYHRDLKSDKINFKEFQNKGIAAKHNEHYHGFPKFIGIAPNDENWGLLDTLKELNF